MRKTVAVFLFSLMLTGLMAGDVSAAGSGLVHYPEKISKSCRKGRAKVYDLCGDQMAHFEAAARRAAAENKVLLVAFGTEWCIWCHVFQAYVKGGKSKFTYTYGGPREPDARYKATLYERAKTDVSARARALQRFVAKNFVLVSIDGQFAPNGVAVLKRVGAAEHYPGGIPFIFTVDAKGHYAAKLSNDEVEVRRDTEDWYRGYDRAKLLAVLTRMRDAARR